MVYSGKFEIRNKIKFKKKSLRWLQGFDVFCMLDSHAEHKTHQPLEYRNYDLIIAAGVSDEISSVTGSLKDIDRAVEKSNEWYFGFFSYDLKNSIENLASNNADLLGWPDFYFFRPQHLLLLKNDAVTILSSSIQPTELFRLINSVEPQIFPGIRKASVQSRMSKKEYIDSVNNLRKHILRGDIYEVNFCQEYYSETTIDPFSGYEQLSEISPTPFSCFLRLHHKFLISASPERFIKKQGNTIISQPIKGTARRGLSPAEDERIKLQLTRNPKERSENIMIVDLVRNDLSRIAKKRTVRVEELCGIYTFSHVHQMISTITAKLNTHSIEEIIRSTFPMGSMTGAPKIRAMQLAEQYETTKRGLYSGAVGYISPNKDFDFNVVIRSLQYNHAKNYLSYMVGGAITWLSDAEKEYEECLLKAAAIEKLLKG